ncbi:hypothetical protein SAMN04487843_11414 [Methylobacterium sp. ap11]|uniref:hypothetical protein n=1 Tax=Methylobacterium sp. ap11 TaxID=1761799 RepID=UPI0008B83591|nr:hypothetical protein [Methylobacterium sp. ap11]SEP38036.1 hypothetical protein SAMN04487843_11414 [Methylobacterium sp. ap11]
MRRAVLLLALPASVLAPFLAPAALAEDAPRTGEREVCEAKADRSGITGDGRATFLRECEAGERLVRGSAPR